MYRYMHGIGFLHKLSRRYLSTDSWLFRWFYNAVVKRLCFIKRMEINGRWFVVPVRDGIGLQNLVQEYETWLGALVEELSPPKGTLFVDVGANTGQTVMRVLSYRQDLQILAIEPIPLCAAYLDYFISINELVNVKVKEVALSDSESRLLLRTRYSDDIMASTTPGFRVHTAYSEVYEVDAIRGDELGLGVTLPVPGMMKIDVEGGERAVLEGFAYTIQKYRPPIICEILPIDSESTDVTKLRHREARRLLSLLQLWGYSVLNLKTRKTVTHLGDLSKTLDAANYLLIESTRANRFV